MLHNKEKFKLAHKRGYTVVNGEVISPSGHKMKLYKNKRANTFKIMNEERKTFNLAVSTYIGYLKFGDEMFKDGSCVYHADGDRDNNSFDNIKLGELKNVGFYKKPEVRKQSAIIASSKVKKHDHNQIIALYNEGKSYKQIMEITGIKSKGTLSFIIKNSIESNNEINK
jgi:hypothetical protein